MLWKKYIIKTTTADSDMVSAVLSDFGINDVLIENNIQLTDEELNQMYADFVKELPFDDGSCTVSFYLDEKGFIPEGVGTGDSPSAANEKPDYEGVFVDISEVKAALSEAHELFGIEEVEIDEEKVDASGWDTKWKEYFKPFSIGDVLVKPSWEDVCEGNYRVVINIDPGMAFGTGMHETTRLCMLGLQKYIKPGMKVLDLGCGSGILGIAALKLGAGYVYSVDIDEQAVRIAEENFEINGPYGEGCEYKLKAGNIMQDAELKKQLSEEKFDIVLANILADVIVPLSGDVDKYMNKGGIFISSGIIDKKETDVKEAVNNNENLTLLEIGTDGEWRSVTAGRK